VVAPKFQANDIEVASPSHQGNVNYRTAKLIVKYSRNKEGIINQAAIRHSTEPSIRTELDSGVRPIPYKKQFGGMTSF